MSEPTPGYSYGSSDKYYLLKDNCVVAELGDWREAAALSQELNRLLAVEAAARRLLELFVENKGDLCLLYLSDTQDRIKTLADALGATDDE